MPLGEYQWFTAALTLGVVPALGILTWLAWPVFQLGMALDPEMDFSLRILSGLASIAVALGALTLFQRFRAPRPFANFDTDRVRLGRHEVLMTDLVWAQFLVTGSVKRPGISLLIGSDSKKQAAFRLRSGNGYLIDGDTARLVSEVLRRSAVEMPKDRFDPKGRFLKTTFPMHLTRDEAIDAVLAPEDFTPDFLAPPA
ncbi:hypothetical protein [Planctomonas psychrotolerans]|uniref:hypothetical protein n=1 Tax=Planctomonas psychrotolerans TaxID=2528712 RepID=UPI0012392A7C|nr:hypothetical protein [Planctomonas psychrotolerans]